VNTSSACDISTPDGREIHWDFIRAIWSSVADTAIAPLQDLLGLDTMHE
jgi:hypothetical protein